MKTIRYKIQALPVANQNINFNDFKIIRGTIAETTVYAIAAGYNKIYDEKGNGFQEIDLVMLAKAAGKGRTTLADGCGCPTGANHICEGVFIKGMHDLRKDPEFPLQIKKFDFSNKDDLELFLYRMKNWCGNSGRSELAKLAARKFDDDVWYRAFEPYFATMLPRSKMLNQEDAKGYRYKLVVLFKQAFADWSRIEFNLLHEKIFDKHMLDAIGLIRLAIDYEIKNKPIFQIEG